MIEERKRLAVSSSVFTAPDMMPKAYRWVAEMQEIANFIAADGAGDIYTGASNVYERIARAISVSGPEINSLREFYAAAATRP